MIFLKNNITVKIIILILLTLFISGIFNSIYSQSTFNKYINVPLNEQPKTFIDIIFNLTESAYGINFAQKNRVELKDKTGKIKVEQDTNRIDAIRETLSGDKVNLYLTLDDYESKITITVYNMIGKKVLDVFDNYPYKDPGLPYEIRLTGPPSLPNGMYLCVVVGKNFRLREKFVVSKK